MARDGVTRFSRSTLKRSFVIIALLMGFAYAPGYPRREEGSAKHETQVYIYMNDSRRKGIVITNHELNGFEWFVYVLVQCFVEQIQGHRTPQQIMLDLGSVFQFSALTEDIYLKCLLSCSKDGCMLFSRFIISYKVENTNEYYLRVIVWYRWLKWNFYGKSQRRI